MAMAFYEIPATLCVPLTAYIIYKMAWTSNLKVNLMGEVLMISVRVTYDILNLQELLIHNRSRILK